MDIIKPAQVLSYPSEMCVHTKNYDKEHDFWRLCAPSDLFFAVCKIHIKVFENLFSNSKEIKNKKNYCWTMRKLYQKYNIFLLVWREQRTYALSTGWKCLIY